MKIDIRILAALVVAIPITLAIAFSIPILLSERQYATQFQNDHKLIIEHNNTLNQLSGFLTNIQLPFDCKLVKVNDTIQHCIAVMQGGK